MAKFKPLIGFPVSRDTSRDEWRTFFAKSRYKPDYVGRQIDFLLQEKLFEQVIRALEAAIIEGQSQPWMYETLAMSMELENLALDPSGKTQKYTKEEIERVVLSMADFGNVNFESMMYSGAYLSRLERNASAIKMYQQAARMSPERHEPYAMGLRIAAKTRDPEEVQWAACGTLRQVWGPGHAALHQEAEDLLIDAERQLMKLEQPEKLAQLQSAALSARQRDVMVRLDWSGEADLDLIVEDPAGGVCTYEAREGVGGGIHLGDGYGPTPEDCHEDYICSEGFSGDYKITVKRDMLKLVGQRAILTITTHARTSEEKKITRSVNLSKETEVTITITVEDGRRQERRTTSQLPPAPTREEIERTVRLANRPLPRATGSSNRAVISDLQRSRQIGAPPEGLAGGARNPAGGSAIGFRPNITSIREGASLAASAVVSPDRRYVRLAISPTFNQIVDVVTFSFPGGF